jgi:hypothetical protein
MATHLLLQGYDHPGQKEVLVLMLRVLQLVIVFLAYTALGEPASGKSPHKDKATDGKAETTQGVQPVLWRDPTNLESRDLFYGSGGPEHAPHPGIFAFVKEDLDGSNPKYVVRDDSGIKWKIKLGPEAKPEVAASRLVWAVGYFTNEDYFLPEVRVLDLPVDLHRGRKLFAHDGTVRDVRFKREEKGEAKDGTWKWKRAPFTGEREFNGLRVLMALINNWDVKDVNNSVREKTDKVSGNSEDIYMVKDLGASFGSPGFVPGDRARGNLQSYSHSRFITKTTADYVSFATPARPSLTVLVNPLDYMYRMRLRWVGRKIPRSDVKWIGSMLARLSPNQVREAFRAAGYSEPEVEGFAGIIETRIAALSEL